MSALNEFDRLAIKQKYAHRSWVEDAERSHDESRLSLIFLELGLLCLVVFTAALLKIPMLLALWGFCVFESFAHGQSSKFWKRHADSSKEECDNLLSQMESLLYQKDNVQ